MLMTDILLGVFTVAVIIVGAVAYFAGAKAQLRQCARYRTAAQWMSDDEWMRTASIANNRYFPRMK